MTDDFALENPFDPDVTQWRAGTPEWDDIIREAMRQHTMEMRVAMPGIVIAVNGTALVDVQPTLQQCYNVDGAATDIVALKNIPVCLPSGAQYSLKVPIAPGDSGLLVFCDRSLANWSASDGKRTVDTQSTRQHHLSDAIFLPGCWPLQGQVQDKTSDLVVQAGASQVRLLQNGKLVIGSTAAGGQELLSVIDAFMANTVALMDTLAQALVLTSFGPAPFVANTVSSLAALKAQAQQIQGNLDALKGASDGT